MGKIKKILENNLVGGTQTTDIYPITSIKAIYDENNERLDNIINRRGIVNISTNYNSSHIAETLTLTQAIAKVPSKDRVLGFQGKFKTSEGWKLYIFTGDYVSSWSDISKWIELVSSAVLAQELGDSTTKAVSQNAVTKSLEDSSEKINSKITELDNKLSTQLPAIEEAKNVALDNIRGNEQSAINNFNSQRVTPEMLSESTKQLIEASGGGTITNFADEEDLTSVNDGTGSNILKFADRTYNPDNFSGNGYKILRKNIIDGKNVLTQNMINKSNTIYVIQYDFTLGENITVPANCVLEFDGGSVNGAYTITGTETIIKAIPVQIFGNDITIGYNSFIPYNNVIYPEWFGINDLGSAISASCNIKANQSVIKLQPKTYHLTTPAKLVGGVIVDLNNAIVNVDADVPAFVDINYQKETNYSCSGINIKDGVIRLTTERTEGTSYVIDIANASFLNLKNLYFEISDGITLNSAFGIRLGRKTTGYTGPTYVNTIKDCTLYHIKIESDTTDSYMINNKIWASNINDGAINISASSWQIISNQIVGGKKGAIYIPPYGKPSGLKIIGNYFDGSYYNLDTQNGINIDYDAASDTYMINSIISNNNFWHQKKYGIYGKMINCIITNNIFDDCDFYNEGVPDILLKGGGECNQICSNTFVRAMYVDLKNVHHVRIEQDTEAFTRPPIIKTEDECWKHHIIQNNVCASENYYNKAVYAESDSQWSYVLVNNCSPIFCNNGWHGNLSKRPKNVQIGFQYFDTSLSPARPIYWNGSTWIDATGAEV